MEYPYNLSKEEVVRRLEYVHHAIADPGNVTFDLYNQLLACESIAESEEAHVAPHELKISNVITKGFNESVSVKGSGNGTYKRSVKSKLTESKREAITKLQKCGYKTPPREVASLLAELFIDFESKENHWLYIAQNWPPRAINRVIYQMNKQHRTGEQTIKNPAAYFTHLIKFRKKRKNRRKGKANGA